MLTDTLIRKVMTPLKPTKLADERAMYLLLTPAGGRLWRLKYRFAGKEKLLALGSYPDQSLAKARGSRRSRKATIRQRSAKSRSARKPKQTPTTSRRWSASGWRTSSRDGVAYRGDPV